MKTVTVIVTVDLLVLANSDAEATGIVKEKKAIVPLIANRNREDLGVVSAMLRSINVSTS
jgi:hypothetical protein